VRKRVVGVRTRSLLHWDERWSCLLSSMLLLCVVVVDLGGAARVSAVLRNAAEAKQPGLARVTAASVQMTETREYGVYSTSRVMK
jgi:hypothetical protein